MKRWTRTAWWWTSPASRSLAKLDIRIFGGKLDHQFLNDVVDFNPTAENMARWVCEQVPHCYKVQIQESEGNVVEYER